jgi:hypothetical protein
MHDSSIIRMVSLLHPGRVSAGSMSMGPICILHNEDDLNVVGDRDPYIPE